VLVILAGRRDGRKVIIAVESGYRESTERWAALLRDLKGRGLRAPRLVVGDGHLGIWGALTAVFPMARQQRCWNHRLQNALDKLPKRLQAEGRRLLTAIPYADTREDAERQKRAFQAWCTKKAVSLVGQMLDQDWERLVTAAAKRYKKVENATAVIWKTLLIADRTFRRLDARPRRRPPPELHTRP
jgi:transposase-like protein